MTRGECHIICLGWIVSNDQISATVRIIFAVIENFFDLIDTLAIKIPPLISVDRSEISPFFCEVDIIFYLFDEGSFFLSPFR